MAESDTDYRCGQQPSYGYGMPGQGMMEDGYGMPGQGMMGQGYQRQSNYEQIPEVKAKKMLDQYIKDNLKGFEITKIEKERVRMGVVYIAIVKDNNGNEFEIHLNPWGYIRGLFVR
ncbi:MAG: hypothetical protein RQ763_10205 [Sulfurimonas sp.]|uniref:hypothetical protein n=1 Tax=Sulfurimonas sp. TaxID=2022749 RepID=UPI0028CFA795|nr:hypothetical protein [Sulfurimonas sp.]MDT8339563.1 hypothetical protein [Sulfurimonas sp.]